MTQYLYGNPGNPFQITASRSSDNTLTTYSYDTSGNLFAFERAGTRYYVATDHLGTPKVVTYDNGTIVKQAEYDAWGVKLSDSAPGFELPVGFAGGIPEALTGLVRFGFRDYEPGTGRWVARDPILFEGGQGNLYNYAGTNPVSNVDSNGLVTLQIGFGGSFGSGIGWTGSSGFVFGYSKEHGLQFGTYQTRGFGAFAGASASLSLIELTGSLNGSICDLSGEAITIQKQVGIPPSLYSGTVEVNIPRQNGIKNSYGGAFNFGKGPTFIETHGINTTTYIQRWW